MQISISIQNVIKMALIECLGCSGVVARLMFNCRVGIKLSKRLLQNMQKISKLINYNIRCKAKSDVASCTFMTDKQLGFSCFSKWEINFF